MEGRMDSVKNLEKTPYIIKYAGDRFFGVKNIAAVDKAPLPHDRDGELLWAGDGSQPHIFRHPLAERHCENESIFARQTVEYGTPVL